VVNIEATGLAEKTGNIRFANMVALGAMAKLTGVLSIDGIDEILKKFFSPDKHRFIPKNVEAIEAGFNAV
jgi:2-oxoglutarate ferredoxin oxidoreductase subunit gamma